MIEANRSGAGLLLWWGLLIKKVGSEISEENFPKQADYNFAVDTTVAYSIIILIKEKGINYDGDRVQPSILSSLLPYLSFIAVIAFSFFILERY